MKSVARSSTDVISSCFHTPSELARRIFYAVLRAGTIRCDPSYRIERPRYPGHDLLLCTDGAGVVSVDGRRFAVGPRQVAWIDCALPHAHEPDPVQPWSLRWVRIDGPLSAATARALLVRDDPVFAPPPAVFAELMDVHRRLITHMEARAADVEARLHAEVSVLIARLVSVRQGGGVRQTGRHHGIARVLARLAADHQSAFSVPELARLAGMSPAQFFRRFRETTGSTPLAWLRRERLRHAQRLLLESDEAVQQIAFTVGYRDAFYFSRDFRKHVGVSPSAYRRGEGGAPA